QHLAHARTARHCIESSGACALVRSPEWARGASRHAPGVYQERIGDGGQTWDVRDELRLKIGGQSLPCICADRPKDDRQSQPKFVTRPSIHGGNLRGTTCRLTRRSAQEHVHRSSSSVLRLVTASVSNLHVSRRG